MSPDAEEATETEEEPVEEVVEEPPGPEAIVSPTSVQQYQMWNCSAIRLEPGQIVSVRITDGDEVNWTRLRVTEHGEALFIWQSSEVGTTEILFTATGDPEDVLTSCELEVTKHDG